MTLSTHILDTALGRPVANVDVTLSLHDGDNWHELVTDTTDIDGRCKNLLGSMYLAAITYKLRFHTAPYFHALHLPSLYPYVDIVFTVTDPTQHHHIPLLLTANGYTTYRGS